MKFNLQAQKGTAKTNLDDQEGEAENIPHKVRSKKSAKFPATLQNEKGKLLAPPVKKLSMA